MATIHGEIFRYASEMSDKFKAQRDRLVLHAEADCPPRPAHWNALESVAYKSGWDDAMRHVLKALDEEEDE